MTELDRLREYRYDLEIKVEELEYEYNCTPPDSFSVRAGIKREIEELDETIKALQEQIDN
jgi:hypothetical protein